MKLFLVFAILFANLTFANISFAGIWKDEIGIVAYGKYSALAISTGQNGAIYAGAESGLFKRPNKSAEWTKIFDCRGECKGINEILIDKDRDRIYIATKNGLYRSADGGATWTRRFKGVGIESNCTSVFIDQHTKPKIYLGTQKGLFSASVGEEKWQRSDGAPEAAHVTAICGRRSGEDLFLYTICDSELYMIDTKTGFSEKLFGSGYSEEREEDSDAPMTDQEEASLLLNDIQYQDDILYLSTNRGLYISRDMGRSWKRFNDTGLTNRAINHILPGKHGLEDILAATAGGVFQYIGKQGRWSVLQTGMDSSNVSGLILDRTGGKIWAFSADRIYSGLLSGFNSSIKENALCEHVISDMIVEPTVDEVRTMAINYAEVHPDKIREWRRGARMRAMFPKVSFGIDRSLSDTYEIYTSSTRSYWTLGPEDKTEGWDLNFSWDLADLVWNESQTSIDVRSKLMVQLREDIVDQVIRLYFERLRLQSELKKVDLEGKEADPDKVLRLKELTAGLDGLTGGGFSETIRRRQQL
ncbi:MAG: hypothetical protein ABID09_07650 [Candidatus Omnitrophota bacterium]